MVVDDADDDSNSPDEGTYPTFPSLSHFSIHSAHYTALNLTTPAIALSKLLTPAPLVHPVTISQRFLAHLHMLLP